MDVWVVQFLSGISYGMLLFLLAAGFSLIMGVMGILNLAHGSLYVLGAYVGLMWASQGGNFLVAALIGALAGGLLGLAIERGLLRHLHGLDDDQVLLTLGIVYVFENLVLWIWGPFAKVGAVPSFLSFSINIGGLAFPVYRFGVMAIGLAIALGLWFLQEKTRIGAIIRAGMDDREITEALGLNYGLICSAVFFLGAFVAGLAGFIGTGTGSIAPGMSFPTLLLALVVVVVGGRGSIKGSLVGGLLIGIIIFFSKALFPEFAAFVPYLAMIIVLLVKPSGLFGKRQA